MDGHAISHLGWGVNSNARWDNIALCGDDDPSCHSGAARVLFQPKFEELDLLQLPNYSIYLKLMIDGTPSAPFSAATLGPGTTALSPA